MSSLQALKGQLLNTRKIDVSVYDAGEERVLVEGVLRDDRNMNVYTDDGRCLGPGQVHGMTVRLLLGGSPPRILDAEAEMPRTPREECPQTADSVKKLIGMDIVHGFSKETIQRIGGTKGCLHITKLILSMATPALHGWAINNHLHPDQAKPASSSLLDRIKNSCYIWREGGEAYNEVADRMQKLRNAAANHGQATDLDGPGAE